MKDGYNVSEDGYTEGKTKTISVKCDSAFHDWITRLSVKSGRTISEVIRGCALEGGKQWWSNVQKENKAKAALDAEMKAKMIDVDKDDDE